MNVPARRSFWCCRQNLGLWALLSSQLVLTFFRYQENRPFPTLLIRYISLSFYPYLMLYGTFLYMCDHGMGLWDSMIRFARQKIQANEGIRSPRNFFRTPLSKIIVVGCYSVYVIQGWQKVKPGFGFKGFKGGLRFNFGVKTTH